VLDLSPTKLLIIFVVAVVLLGPKRLPQVARQLGAGWRKVKAMRDQIDSELRRSVPDLPTSQEIVHFARAPLRVLDHFANLPPEPSGPANGPGSTAAAAEARPASQPGSQAVPVDAASAPAAQYQARSDDRGLGALAGVDTDDPSLN
jgi:TatA/E family protein of Tat protein translocase